MPAVVATINTSQVKLKRLIHIREETLTTTGPTDSASASRQYLTGEIVFQLTGTATAVEARIERATKIGDWAPVDNTTLTGNPSAGIQVASSREPNAAYYRLNVLTLTGGNLNVSISGDVA